MNNRYVFLCAVLCASPWVAFAHDVPRDPAPAKQRGIPPSTSQVLMSLHEASLTEIQAGQLARDNSNSDDIMNYGKQLIDDHQKADADVKELANDRNVKLPGSLPHSSSGYAMLAKLRGLRGEAFDRQFLEMMISDHEILIGKAKSWQADVQDKKLDALLSRLLPTLEKHRDIAHKLAKE